MRNIKFLIIFSILYANLYANSFETNCKSCHFQPLQLSSFMARYTLKYSSEEKIKKAMFDFLKNPTMQTSVMPKGFIGRWGVKEKTQLNDEELQKALDTYYKEYNLHQKLK